MLSERIVAGLASARSFERGVRYLQDGHVGPLRVSGARVSATVQGAESYAVTLTADAGRLRFACSCPVGREGAFCKHCVAVALCWVREHGSATPTLDDARRYLDGLPAASLVELLIEHAHDDERLARRLLLLTTRPEGGAAIDLVSLRALVNQAFAYHGFVPYREVWGFVQGIEETIDLLDGLLADGRAGEVVELVEFALAAVEQSLEGIDDSDGLMSGVAERLEVLHLDACRSAAVDPVVLAGRLFAREIEGHWDIFDRAVLRYAEILGESGLARYRELAEECWATVPVLAPGDGSRRSYGSRFRITRIMEALAELSGSLADQIAVRERDLASGYSFLQIAELCRSHGDEEAELISCGAHVILFTTGRGSVVGSAISPVIKICANPETYERMRDDMDIDAGQIIAGEATVDTIAEEICRVTMAVAAGELTRSETLGHQEFILGYKSFEPVGPACHPGFVPLKPFQAQPEPLTA